ncbi:lipid A export permease/ATP-binding protein MsbA [Bermanella marisrubri]|uniref:Lipid A export ATP-binding/permease protein MsbA n=1 Tax=Bermanella marisrubri TaxID=207949 RepID=Q1N4W3_9GAMM|nr:lipid A export permease/ATP-binding protein MsbA [Bermanella marisrubri]EAT13315.1 lipid A export ATP-binding/permease protein MsbA [Oceanobacter sp. RED65] [Bermanella marisrubri]QIZ84075.1 lipid A export permease/ATP-binding protein MsbA [Bermanella marisrubri]
MTETPSSSDWALYKRLFSYVLKYKLMFFVAIFGFALYASSAPMLAHLMVVIEATYHNPTEWSRFLLVLMILGIYLFRGVGSFLGDYFLAKVGRTVVHNLRTHVFNHYLLLPNDFYDKHAKGHLISKITFDAEQVFGSVTNAVTSLIREGLTVIGLLAYMLWMNWKLTMVFFIAAPFIAFVVSKANGYFKRYSRNVQGSMGKVTQVAGESINAYQEIKIFSGQDYERNRFAKASDGNRRQTIKFLGVKAISVPVMQMIVAFAIASLIWVALDPRIIADMSFGDFMAFVTAASTLAKPMRTLASINSLIQQGIVAAKSMFDVLDEIPEPDHGSYRVNRADGELQISKLSFSYPDSDEQVLNAIDLHIKPGQSVALVGQSGSGKSTIVSLLTRFYDANQGQIKLDGRDLNEFDLANLREQISLVSQSVTLFNDTVYNNIAYGDLANKTEDEVYAAAKAAHALEFIEEMPEGMQTLIGDDGVMLSGGQRQRLAIARAILKDAPILILDEATSALDTQSERYIQEALETLMQDRTSIVVAHRLSTIEKVDSIVVINQGRIVEQGSHEELLARGGAYKNLYEMQFT